MNKIKKLRVVLRDDTIDYAIGHRLVHSIHDKSNEDEQGRLVYACCNKDGDVIHNIIDCPVIVDYYDE